MEKARNFLSRSRMLQIATSLFILLTVWWGFTKPFDKEILISAKYMWSVAYVIMSILGGVYGIIINNKIGGHKSIIGRVIIALSIGLFLQSFGQVLYNYDFLYKQIDVPYPSLGDIGYFGSIFAYIYAVFILARYIGINISFWSFYDKIISIIIPLAMLVFSYFMFLDGYVFDWSNKLKIFLDFGYPLGQMFYISIALLILSVSGKIFGGMLRKPVFFLVLTLALQYIADSYFIFNANNNTWYAGGVGDYLYFLAYFTMAFAIVYIGDALDRIRTDSAKIPETSFHVAEYSIEQVYNQIVIEIIKRQVNIAGGMAWIEVRKVPGILVHDENTFNITIASDPKRTIDALVYRYKNFFGDLAVVVSKNAVYNLLSQLTWEEVPDSLK